MKKEREQLKKLKERHNEMIKEHKNLLKIISYFSFVLLKIKNDIHNKEKRKNLKKMLSKKDLLFLKENNYISQEEYNLIK